MKMRQLSMRARMDTVRVVKLEGQWLGWKDAEAEAEESGATGGKWIARITFPNSKSRKD